MTAHLRGAHAARVLAMTSLSSRTFSLQEEVTSLLRKIVSAWTPKPAREPRALPEKLSPHHVA
jgi:hypothetical protein